MNFIVILCTLATFVAVTSGQSIRRPITINQEPTCNLSQSVVNEIQSYRQIANEIINLVVHGELKGKAFENLAQFVDKFPNRLTGGKGLEDSIDYMINKFKENGIQNVVTESASVTHWTRGEEKAEILQPTPKKLDILGLGGSVGTPPQGIVAQVVVVHNYTELDEKKDLVRGKIVVYNQGWLGSYGATVAYRGGGAVPAAEYGAVAVLVESVTPFSLNTPHTGGTNYSPNVTKIPIASITREDAEFLSRLYTRGENITISLKLMDEVLPMTQSRNTFANIPGRQTPDEIVAVSGHIDAWDVGQGVHDDAGGIIISAEALMVIQHLNLKPRRTLQAIFWTAEEQGLEGVQSFVNNHRADMVKYNAVFESDGGTFLPRGLDFAGSPEAGCIVMEVLKLVENINATAYARYSSVGSDISFMVDEGVPGLSLNNANEKYFYYHHSPADTLTAQDPDELDLCTALWAVTSYVLADLSVALPREK